MIEQNDPSESQRQEILSAIKTLSAKIHLTAVSKGWWEKDRNDGEMIALMHSELSEALENIRHGCPPSDKIPEFSGVEEEYADCIIRILDASYKRGYRIGEAILAKMEHNKCRSYKHGGKSF